MHTPQDNETRARVALRLQQIAAAVSARRSGLDSPVAGWDIDTDGELTDENGEPYEPEHAFDMLSPPLCEESQDHWDEVWASRKAIADLYMSVLYAAAAPFSGIAVLSTVAACVGAAVGEGRVLVWQRLEDETFRALAELHFGLHRSSAEILEAAHAYGAALKNWHYQHIRAERQAAQVKAVLAVAKDGAA
jgi:hypothetical protein